MMQNPSVTVTEKEFYLPIFLDCCTLFPCHTLKFLNFRILLKLKIKQQFSHNFKIFSTFIFLHREFSVKENKYWLFFKLNDVVLLVMHSCHMHSVVECENLSKRVLSSKVLPGNFPDFSGFFSHFP